jgi:aarF domain-containing kinase
MMLNVGRRLVFGGGTAALAAAIGVTATTTTKTSSEYFNYENAKRTTTFWYHALPAYLSYRYVQRRNELFHRFHQKQNLPGDDDDDVMSSSFPLSTMFSSFFLLSDTDANAEYEKLHNYFSPIIEKQVWEQRGFYIKHAQFLSTRDDFVPEKYLEWCKKVQDQAPTKLEKGEALKIAEESLRGTKYENAIEYWEETPIGVASIGAVHRCRLRGESKTCVVKVQAPEVESRFRNDVDTMIFFLRLFQPQHVPPLKEVQRNFLNEFDYRIEAENLREMKRLIEDGKFSDRVKIPEPKVEMCSKNALFMEEIEGVPLVRGVKESYERFLKATGKSADANAMRHSANALLADEAKNETNFKDVEETARATRKANAMIRAKFLLIDEPIRLAYNLSPLRLVFGKSEKKPSATLVNLGDVLRTMLDVHAHEIFECGTFNGDPHPGNILLMPDGRLGLIDYGQTVRIDECARRAYAKLVLALLHEDKEEVARLVWSSPPDGFGGKTKKRDVDTAYKLATFWNDRDTPDITEGLNLQEFIDEMERRDPMIDTPRQMVMISRVSVLLRGMGNAFDMRLRVSEAWRKHARALLKKTDPEYYLLKKEEAEEEKK